MTNGENIANAIVSKLPGATRRNLRRGPQQNAAFKECSFQQLAGYGYYDSQI